MKTLLRNFLLSVILLVLVACGSSVTVGSFSSLYHDSDDYDSAVQELMTYLNGLDGCTVKEIGYAGDKVVKKEADSRGKAVEQIIVLTSTFETGDKKDQNGLEPNHSYENYTWILTRPTSDAFWEITDHGIE